MRYQQYKNRMLKIRKVIDFFYRFRFVFAGVIAVIVAGSITLDVSRGSITETTHFKLSYMYGEEISCSGSAFMGKVTYEFRKKGDTEWSEEKPIYPGQYEARAKSKGSHGYKYSDESSFEIRPYETEFKVKNPQVNFGDDSPELEYTLLPGDRLDKNYIVDYADKTVNTTTASINKESIKIYNSDNVDVTPCYSVSTIDKDITFIPEQLTFTFNSPSSSFTYTGDEEHPFTADDYSLKGNLYYGAEPVITGDKRVNIGNEINHHVITIKDKEGNIYNDNYGITIKENYINVTKAPAITITSVDLEKPYDDQPFDAADFTYSVKGLLTNIHEIRDVVFDKTDVKTCSEAKNVDNTFTYKIYDKRTDEEIDPLDYYMGVNIKTGKINITPLEITINTPDKNHTFNNKEVKGYEAGVDEINYTGTLYGDDFIKVDEYPTKTVPGKYSNDYLCHVYRKMMVGSELQDVDVSSNYNIKYNKGNINITVNPIVIKFDGRDLPYNGSPQLVYKNDNQGYISSGTLPAGWTYEAKIYKDLSEFDPFTMTDVIANDGTYKGVESQVQVNIWDEYGNPMIQYYTVDRTTSHSDDANCDVTFIFEESKVTPVDLAISVTDFDPIEYNRKTLEERLDLDSRVSSVGLKGNDEVVVSFAHESQKAIKDANATAYAVGLDIKVRDSITHDLTGGNYNITYNRVEPITSSVKINRKNVTIHTPNISKIYDDSNIIKNKDIDFSGVTVYDEYGDPIDDLEVSFNTNKVYTAPNANAGVPATYDSFENTDIIISDKNTHEIVHKNGLYDNYNINLVEDGQITINKRAIEFFQVNDESKDHIFYDGEYHGVYNGSKEINYTHEDEEQEIGLLESLNHVLNIGNEKRTNIANADGDPTHYGAGEADKVAFYGITITRGGYDVTNNYDIQFPDSYININVIKKKIEIQSASSKKVFDGNVFDLYSDYAADEWVDINSMKSNQFVYQVSRYDQKTGDYVNANLDDGDILQVKKTNAAILADSKNVGNHTNEFEWRVVDKNGATKANDFYNVYVDYGTLEVKKLYIDLEIDHREKEYDSFNITYPNGSFIDSPGNSYQMTVTENSRSDGLLLRYREVKDTGSSDPNALVPFNKTAFESNFRVAAVVYRRNYAKFYLSGDYLFDIETFLYLSDFSTIYNDTSNVELSFRNATLQYRVVKPRIELRRTKVTPTLELRILVGSLRADDTLYFGEEKYTTQLGKKPRAWESEFLLSNVHIYRNDNPSDEVTDCYYIVM